MAPKSVSSVVISSNHILLNGGNPKSLSIAMISPNSVSHMVKSLFHPKALCIVVGNKVILRSQAGGEEKVVVEEEEEEEEVICMLNITMSGAGKLGPIYICFGFRVEAKLRRESY